MTFPCNAYLLAVAGAGATSGVALPLWRRWCLRHGLVDEPGERKIHDRPVPLAGGLAVMTGLALSALVGWLALGRLGGGVEGTLWSSPPATAPAAPGAPVDPLAAFLLRYGLGPHTIELGGLLLGALGILAVGWLDDWRELRPRVKFAGQLLVAALVAASGVRLTLWVQNLVFSYALTIFWIVTVINAFNFIDNMNGLCAGVGAIGAWWFAIYGATQSQYLVTLLALSTLGALLGFLPYNFPKARAFLGDAGSHLVGYLLAVLAILPRFDAPQQQRHWAALMPLCVLAVPLLDLVQVVLVRWRLGKPFFVGDTNHLSHRLVRLGFSRKSAVLLLWLAAALGGMVVAW